MSSGTPWAISASVRVRLPAKVDEVIDASIAKLLEHQGYDGGFGFWEDDASQLWLSAYSTLVIEEAVKLVASDSKSDDANSQFFIFHYWLMLQKPNRLRPSQTGEVVSAEPLGTLSQR